MAEYDTNFDRQRLMFHPAEVAHWLQHGTSRGPLYTEMTLTNACNCACIFCGVDFQVNQTGTRMDPEAALRILGELKELGNRAVMFCGDGEPLLHPDVARIVRYGAESMSASMTTNGLALCDANIGILDRLKWIRFSVNAGSPGTYAKVHRVDAAMFDHVLTNLSAGVRRKRDRQLDVVIGVQAVLLNENEKEMKMLAAAVRDIGVDYFSVKPYSRHPLCCHRLEADHTAIGRLAGELSALERGDFRIICREGSMEKIKKTKPYGRCYGSQFMCFLSANGDVWGCNSHVGDPRFLLGNALEQSLADIWNNSRRREVVQFIEEDLDLKECRDVCRMDECNRYLWRLKNPLAHDDFV